MDVILLEDMCNVIILSMYLVCPQSIVSSYMKDDLSQEGSLGEGKVSALFPTFSKVYHVGICPVRRKSV